MSRTGLPFLTFDDFSVAQDFIESHDGAVVLYMDQAGGSLFPLEWDRIYQEFLGAFEALAAAFKNSSITEITFAKFRSDQE
jgi:hypothetical protein